MLVMPEKQADLDEHPARVVFLVGPLFNELVGFAEMLSIICGYVTRIFVQRQSTG
jgi:hypothetical protein